MANVSNVEILGVMSTMPLSATAVAKKLGLAKGSMIQKNLDELLKNGDIKVDNSGRFPVYTKNDTAVVPAGNGKKSKKAPPVIQSPAVVPGGECTHIDGNGDETHLGVDESIRKVLSGYSIDKPATNKSGQIGTRATIPSGKTIFIKEGMTLVIINEKPCYIVDCPVRLVEACHNYARENSISAYKITQLGVGVINGEANVKMADIVCMKIDKINKGARK